MALPVLETFAEYGYDLFHTPEAVYADFCAAGIFRRAGMEVPSTNVSRLHQREALFDVALNNGLSSIISMYVLARDHKGNFLLQEPVAVQTWVKTKLEKLRQIVHGDLNSAIQSQHNVRHIRGLKQVVQSLVDRLEQGKQAALPRQIAVNEDVASQWATNGLVFLSTLQDELVSCERFVNFSSWLLSQFETTELTIPTTSTMFNAIINSAQLTQFLPLPSNVFDLFEQLEQVDSLTSGAVLLYLSLGQASVVSFQDIYDVALSCANSLDLPQLHATHVLALWCIDNGYFVAPACDLLLRESPPEFMDRPVLLILLELLLKADQPSFAFRIYTSFPQSNLEADADVSLLSAVMTICLQLNQPSLAWILCRRNPNVIDTTLPTLIQYHKKKGDVREVLVKMTWSDSEKAIWMAHLSPQEQTMLHLLRAEFNEAKKIAKHHPNNPEIELLLQTVTPSATSFSIPFSTVNLDKPNAEKQSEIHLQTNPLNPAPATSWPKPSKEQFESFFHRPSTFAPTTSNSNLSLPLKKPQATLNSPKRAGTPADQPFESIRANPALPYQWLSTELTPGPHSSSKVAQAKKITSNEEPLELRPLNPDEDVFLTPLRQNIPREAQTLPARRNPLRHARKKY